MHEREFALVLSLVARLAAAAPGSPDEAAAADDAMQFRVHMLVCAEILRQTIANIHTAEANLAESERLVAYLERVVATPTRPAASH